LEGYFDLWNGKMVKKSREIDNPKVTVTCIILKSQEISVYFNNTKKLRAGQKCQVACHIKKSSAVQKLLIFPP